MLLVSQSHLGSVTKSDITYGHQSDHSLISIKLQLNETQRGPGVWKLNNEVLEESAYCDGIVHQIHKVVQSSPCLDDGELWLAIKDGCTKYSQHYCKERSKAVKDEFNYLTDTYEFLQDDLNRNPGNTDALNSIRQVKNRINVLNRLKTNSAIFRSRAKWFRDGETSSKFFFSLEKKKFMAKNMNCVIDDDGNILYDSDDILCEQTKFFYALYKRNPDVKFNLTRNINEPYLSHANMLSCETELTCDELFDAVMTLRGGRTPGSDGLSLEFYKKFFKLLSPFMLSMYEQSFKDGKLPLSARRGLLSLIPKRGKDPKYIKNKRPLAILNYDYKILAKAMDNRLKLVIDDLVGPEQCGFLKGRRIADNLRQTLDIIEYCKKTGKAGILLSVDMEKCFDKLSHQAITGSLEYFGFGKTFQQWVALFFSDFEICTQNLGFTSQYFKKEQGVNQGCPISPSLFLLSGAILANKLKNNSYIRGIKVGDSEYLLTQFADDMNLFLEFDKYVLDAVTHTFDLIQTNTGLKVSYDKTTIYRIGSLANTSAKLITARNFRWADNCVEWLGINVSNDPYLLSSNYDAVISKIKTVAHVWYYRQLTLKGKILIANSLLGSMLVYKMQVLHEISDKQTQEIDRVLLDFLWKKKKPKIPLWILR